MIFVREFLPEISNENAVPNFVTNSCPKNKQKHPCTRMHTGGVDFCENTAFLL
jgi:hypothetical protein